MPPPGLTVQINVFIPGAGRYKSNLDPPIIEKRGAGKSDFKRVKSVASGLSEMEGSAAG